MEVLKAWVSFQSLALMAGSTHGCLLGDTLASQLLAVSVYEVRCYQPLTER